MIKKIFIVLCAVVFNCVLIYLLGSSPFLFSAAKNRVISFVQERYGIPVHIETVRGNIFHSVKITDVRIEDAVKIGDITLSYNVLKLLQRKIDIRYVHIDGLTVNVDRFDTLVQKVINVSGTTPDEEPAKLTIRVRQLSVTNSDLVKHIADKRIGLMCTIQGSLTEDAIAVDTLLLKTSNSYLSVRGNVALDTSNSLDLTYSTHLFPEDFDIDGFDVAGTVTSTGSVLGTLSAPKITSRTEVNISDTEYTVTGSINSEWQLPLIDSLFVNGRLDLETKAFDRSTNIQSEKWNLVIGAQGRSISCDVFSSYGKMNIRGTIAGDISDPEISTDIRGTLTYPPLTVYVSGAVIYKKNSVLFRSIRCRGQEVEITGNAVVDLDEQQALSASFLISCRDLNIITGFFDVQQTINGGLFADAELNGALANPRASGSVRLEDLQAFGETVSEAEFDFVYRNSVISIDSGSIISPRGAIAIDGMYDVLNDTFKAHAESKNIQFSNPEVFDTDTLKASGGVGFSVDVCGTSTNPCGEGHFQLIDIMYDTLSLGDYDVYATLKDSVLHVDLQRDDTTLMCRTNIKMFQPYSFDTEIDLRHFNLAQYARSNEAYINARISASGNGSDPFMTEGYVMVDTLYASMERTPVYNTDTIYIIFGQQIIDIVSCVLSVHGQRLNVKGRVPFDLANGNLDLRMETSEIEIADLAAIIPNAPSVTGLLKMDVTVHGRLTHPSLHGQIDLKNLRYSVQDVVMDSVDGHIAFRDNTAAIEYVRGKINSGAFDIKGYAVLSYTGLDSAFLDASVSRIDIKNKEFGSAMFSGSILANARNDSVTITGDINIDKAVYEVPFDLQTIIQMVTRVNQPPQEQLDVLSKIYCNVDVSSVNGVGVKNNVARVSADADLQIKGFLSNINVYGTIATSEKGSVNYLGKKFDIESAILQFDNPYEINPDIDINATHVVSSDDIDYEIYMHVGGTLRDWKLELTSSPPVPEQDMISLLLIGRRRPGSELVNDLNLKGAAKDYALGLARGTIERRVERTLGVDKFTITGDLLDPRRLDIGIEKRLFRRFTVLYTTGIESWELRRFGINYDLTDNVSIFTLYDQENLNSSVDLDFHFEKE